MLLADASKQSQDTGENNLITRKCFAPSRPKRVPALTPPGYLITITSGVSKLHYQTAGDGTKEELK
jgi:hypothetical protein